VSDSGSGLLSAVWFGPASSATGWGTRTFLPCLMMKSSVSAL